MVLGRGLRRWRSSSAFRQEAVITIAFTASYFLLSVIQGPLLARNLGPTQRGDLAAVYVPFLTFGWVVVLGLPAAAAYYVRTFPEREIYALANRAMFLVGWPLALLLGLVAPAYLDGRPPETVTGLRILLLVTALLIPVQVMEELIRARDGSNLRYNVLRTIRPVLCLLLLIVLAVAGRLTLGAAIGAFAIGTVVGALLELHLGDVPFTFQSDRTARRRQMSYGLRSAGEGLAGTVVARVDQLILAAANFRAELGLYTVAATLAQLSAPLSIGVKLALFPAIQRSADPAAGRRLTIRAAVAVALGSTAIAGVLAAVSPFLLTLGFGEEFRDAYAMVLLLLPGEIAYDVANVLSSEFQARGRPGINTQAMGIAAIATAVLVPLAIGSWGAEGAAAVTSVAYALRLVYLVLRWRAPPGHDASYGVGDPDDELSSVRAPA